MRLSSALVLTMFAVTTAGCGGDLSSQAGLSSRYPQCLQKSQELYDYLRTGADHSAGHTMDLGMADRRADILYAPPDAQDGLMRAEAQRGILDRAWCLLAGSGRSRALGALQSGHIARDRPSNALGESPYGPLMPACRRLSGPCIGPEVLGVGEAEEPAHSSSHC